MNDNDLFVCMKVEKMQENGIGYGREVSP